MVPGQTCSEVAELTPTRRSFLLVPALGLLPSRTQSKISIPEPLPATRILFGGDVMLSRYVGAIARQRADPAWPLHDLADLFSSADIAFVNLEAPFSDRGRKVESGMIFKAEPEMVEALRVRWHRHRIHGQQSCAGLRPLRRGVHARLAAEKWHRDSRNRTNRCRGA